MDTDDGLASFSPTREESQELDSLNEIRDYGKFNDLVGEKLLDRIWILQGARSGFRTNNKKMKKAK